MPLTKLQFRPGINRETTSYTNEGGWFDGDKIRFRAGMPEKIGGWQRIFQRSYVGTARSLHSWKALSGTRYIGVGTHLKFYINEGGGYNDITPIRSTVTETESISITPVGVVGTGQTGSPFINDISVEAFGEVGFVTVEIDGVVDGVGVGTGVQATGGVGTATVLTDSNTSFVQIAFSATPGSDEITITDQNHGAVVNDFVTFSGATGLGGNITANILNQEYQITEVVDTDTYKIRARTVSTIYDITFDGVITPTYVTANVSDTGSGGNVTVAEYQINTGLDTSLFGTGWGAGTWSRGAWGSAATIDTRIDTLRLWSQDNFGEDLIFNVRDGGVYYWDTSVNSATTPFTRAVLLSSLPGASNAPTIAKQVLVSDVDRHVIAFGCNPLGSSVQDPLLIRFSNQENATDWTPTATNTAGDLLIGSGSEIICAVETRQQILVFTDISLHAMQYLGPPFTFGISMISENTSIMSPMSTVAVDDTVFWMGQEEFYVYNGSVSKLPCTVKDFVFSDLNIRQREKIFGATNLAFSEIWWFYPSADSDNLNRYVVYNYEQGIWYYGTLARTAWIDRGVEDYPVAAGTDGHLYYHEIGFDDGSTNPASAIAAYIESSQIDIADGDQFSFVRRLIPDLTFRNSSSLTPSATFTLKARNFPGGEYLQSNDRDVAKIASVPVEQFTDQVFVRLRGRSMALRVSSDDTGVGWRLGSPRIDVRPDGRR